LLDLTEIFKKNTWIGKVEDIRRRNSMFVKLYFEINDVISTVKQRKKLTK